MSPADLHHLTFVCRDLDVAEAALRKAHGLDEPLLREGLPGRGVRTARARIGRVWYVLVQPIAEGLPAQHLRERGEGLMLMSYRVESLEAAVAQAHARGLQTRGPPRIGVDGWRVVDLDVEPLPGVTLQLCEDARA